MNFDEFFDNEFFYVGIIFFFFILQSGFDFFYIFILFLSQNLNAKVSKVVMLQKSKLFILKFLGYCIFELLKCFFNFFNFE